MAVTGPGEDRPGIEIRVSGLIYIRVERCPRWLAHLLSIAAATLAVAIQPGWLAVRELGSGAGGAAWRAWFLIFCEPARRVVVVTDRRP